jgi:hypothetical protein
MYDLSITYRSIARPTWRRPDPRARLIARVSKTEEPRTLPPLARPPSKANKSHSIDHSIEWLRATQYSKRSL